LSGNPSVTNFSEVPTGLLHGRYRSENPLLKTACRARQNNLNFFVENYYKKLEYYTS